MTNHKHTAL